MTTEWKIIGEKSKTVKSRDSPVERLGYLLAYFTFIVCSWRQNLNLIVFSISILDPPKSKNEFLDAHYIPRVSNDTRENHRQPSLTRLTKVWRARGAGRERSRGWQWAESDRRGREGARARTLIYTWLMARPGAGDGKMSLGCRGRFSPIFVVIVMHLYVYFFIYP